MIATALAVSWLAASAVTGTAGAADPFAVRPGRDRAELVPGCAHMNPTRRPRGSNCYGIFPEQCGADRISGFEGRSLDATLRAQIEAIAPPSGVRFIVEGEPFNQDLRRGRLNVWLGRTGRVVSADCF